jgi:site-specific recombinase XerD
MARGELRAFLESIARKTPIRANRVLALVRAAFRWGLREELIERDPTAGLQRPRPRFAREQSSALVRSPPQRVRPRLHAA